MEFCYVLVLYIVFKGVLVLYNVFKGVLVLYNVFKGVLVLYSVFKGIFGTMYCIYSMLRNKRGRYADSRKGVFRKKFGGKKFGRGYAKKLFCVPRYAK